MTAKNLNQEMERLGRTGDPGIRTWNGLLKLKVNGKLQSSYLDYQLPVIIGANAQGRVPYIKFGWFHDKLKNCSLQF